MKKFWDWWDRLTMPPAGDDDSPKRREQMRYALFVSRFAFTIYVLILLDLPVVVLSAEIHATLATLAPAILLVLALISNKRGWTIAAGIFCALCPIFADSIPLLIFPGNPPLSTSQLTTLNYLVMSIILAGALLPPRFIPIVAAICCGIFYGVVLLQPQDPGLTASLQKNWGSVLLPPSILFILVAVIIYFVVRFLVTATQRADRAEEILALQELLNQQEKEQLQEKQQLDSEIQNIAQVLAQINNGHKEVRIQGARLLWNISGPINTLLSRNERLREERDLIKDQYLSLQQHQQNLSTMQQNFPSSSGNWPQPR